MTVQNGYHLYSRLNSKQVNLSQRSSLEDWPSTLYTLYTSSIQNCVSRTYIPSVYMIPLIASINFNFIDLKGREGGRERGGREVGREGKKTKKDV